MFEVLFSLAFVDLANLDVGEDGIVEEPAHYEMSASEPPYVKL